MKQPLTLRHAAVLCLTLAIVGGCDSTKQAGAVKDDHGHSHDHDHSDGPKSLPAAITKLHDMWAEISTAMDKSDPEAAHGPLHEVGHLLESIPDLAAETDLPESEWNDIKGDVDQLFAAFGDIDSAFHKQDGDKQAAYEAAKPKIEAGIAALEAQLPLLGEDSTTDDHDDNHDHDEHRHEDEQSAAEE